MQLWCSRNTTSQQTLIKEYQTYRLSSSLHVFNLLFIQCTRLTETKWRRIRTRSKTRILLSCTWEGPRRPVDVCPGRTEAERRIRTRSKTIYLSRDVREKVHNVRWTLVLDGPERSGEFELVRRRTVFERKKRHRPTPYVSFFIQCTWEDSNSRHLGP